MKRKHLLLIVGFLATCICVPLVLYALMPPSPGVTKANFDRIEVGMTLQEVEQILGTPGKYTWGGYWWEANDGARVLVAFAFSGDSAGHKTWDDSRVSTLDKLRRWLHLP